MRTSRTRLVALTLVPFALIAWTLGPAAILLVALASLYGFLAGVAFAAFGLGDDD